MNAACNKEKKESMHVSGNEPKILVCAAHTSLEVITCWYIYDLFHIRRQLNQTGFVLFTKGLV